MVILYYNSFEETFAVAIDILQSFDKIWQKSLFFRLLSLVFFPFLFTMNFSFLPSSLITFTVDGYYFSPKSIDNGVLQCVVFSVTLLFPLCFMIYLKQTFLFTHVPIILFCAFFFTRSPQAYKFYFTNNCRSPTAPD